MSSSGEHIANLESHRRFSISDRGGPKQYIICEEADRGHLALQNIHLSVLRRSMSSRSDQPENNDPQEKENDHGRRRDS
jgi:hypothetical protein